MSKRKPASKGASGNPPGGPVYVARLNTLRGVRQELARVYRLARRHELGTADAYRLAAVLQILGKLLELSELEPRIAALEAAAQERR